jgi:hypothetical protein
MIARFLIVIFSFLMLAGCATVSPNKLGISQSQWSQYSEQQRQQIIHNYHQAQAVEHQLHAKNNHSVLAVKIQGGQVLMPPYTNLQAYQPVAFDIKAGSCHQKVALLSANGSQQKTNLKACYSGDILFLDPSPYDPNLAKGALQFAYMPLWKRGFTYNNVTSSGFTKLTGGSVFIQEVAAGDD